MMRAWNERLGLDRAPPNPLKCQADHLALAAGRAHLRGRVSPKHHALVHKTLQERNHFLFRKEGQHVIEVKSVLSLQIAELGFGQCEPLRRRQHGQFLRVQWLGRLSV